MEKYCCYRPFTSFKKPIETAFVKAGFPYAIADGIKFLCEERNSNRYCLY